MRIRNPLTTTGLCLLAVLIGLSSTATVAAQSAPAGSGEALEIAPPVMNLKGDPGQTITAQISLRDIATTKLLVNGQVNDFIASGEDGTPKILLDGNQSNPYSLRDWVGPLPSLILQPKQIKQLPVTITIPKNASPGGYYGVVRFTAIPPDIKGTGVSLSASLGALVLLKVNGVAKESMSVEELSVKQDGKTGTLFQSTPIQFAVRLKNNGNIFEQPTGQVTITDMFGKKVAVVNVNLQQNNVLPQSIRKFEQSLDRSVIGDKVLFGQYHADLRITYGANKQVVTASTTFWVIPYTLIGGGIIALIGGFFVLRFMIKRYNRHIIHKAQKPRR